MGEQEERFLKCYHSLVCNDALYRDFVDYIISSPKRDMEDFDLFGYCSIYNFMRKHKDMVIDFVEQWEEE